MIKLFNFSFWLIFWNEIKKQSWIDSIVRIQGFRHQKPQFYLRYLQNCRSHGTGSLFSWMSSGYNDEVRQFSGRVHWYINQINFSIAIGLKNGNKEESPTFRFILVLLPWFSGREYSSHEAYYFLLNFIAFQTRLFFKATFTLFMYIRYKYNHQNRYYYA